LAISRYSVGLVKAYPQAGHLISCLLSVPVPAQADKVNATRPTTSRRTVFFIPLSPIIEFGGTIPHLVNKEIHI
jgi:hypothetical protein